MRGRNPLLLVCVLLGLGCFAEGERGQILRTPDERFADLPDWPYQPRYTEISGLRIHHVDEGPRDGRPVLLMHGEPSWSFLYRKMIPVLVEAGLRPIAPDLVGFGRSDKYAHPDDYSYAMQVDVMGKWLRAMDVSEAVFFGQDWGGLVGLRVVADHPDRFAGVVIANTALPLPEEVSELPAAFQAWLFFSQHSPIFPIGRILDTGTTTELSDDVRAAYEAPFPDDIHKAGARIMPSRVPITPDDPALPDQRRAWAVFDQWQKPFLTAFSDRDPVTGGGEVVFQERVPGAANQPHVTIEGAGHFLQEDRGPELARVIVEFEASLPPLPSLPPNGESISD